MDIINRIKKIHDNRYDLSKFIYKSHSDKVSLICDEHGVFEILLSNLINNKRGCPKCGQNNKLTKTRSNTKEFIEKSNKIHDYKYSYEKSNYINWKTKLTIVCKIHGDFTISPNNHLNGQGCKLCKLDERKSKSIERELYKKKLKQKQKIDKLNNRIELFIKKSNKIHDYKFNYEKSVEDILKCGKMTTKIDILCNKHGFFQQTTSHHINGNGCPLCYYESKTGNNRMSKATAIHKCNVQHNYYYNYDLVVFDNITEKVIIVCPEHGSFKTTLSKHMKGSGCKSCKKKKEPNYKYNTSEYLSLLKHNEYYDYSNTIYSGMRNKISIICKKHGEFSVAAHHHKNGIGCRLCGIDNKSLTNKKFIEKSNNIHNNKYTYNIVSDVVKTTQKVSIICKEHGLFKQVAETHLRGSGCNLCHTKSRGEIYIKRFLEDNNIEYIREMVVNIDNKKYRYDFYIKSRNLCIEFDGKHHFEPIKYFGGQKTLQKVMESDKMKNDYCEYNKIGIMRIKYTDLGNINTILKNKLLNVKFKT